MYLYLAQSSSRDGDEDSASEVAQPKSPDSTDTSDFEWSVSTSSFSYADEFGLRRVPYQGGAKLPEGWMERLSTDTKELYFINTYTRKKYYKFPLSVYPLADRPDYKGYIFPWTRFRCSHILVKHSEADNPRSWRMPNITLTKAEALKKIIDIRKMIVSGECGFGEMARAISDCCTARRAGDIGIFRLNETNMQLQNVLLRLKMNELSKVFETYEGYHIMIRTKAANARSRRMRRQDRIASFTVKSRHKLHMATSNCSCRTKSEYIKMEQAQCKSLKNPENSTETNPTQEKLREMYAEQQRWIQKYVIVDESQAFEFENSTNEETSTEDEDDD